MISKNPVDSTSLLELLNKEESLGIDVYNVSVDGCGVYKSLMSICHADNVFPNEHMNSSSLWESVHQAGSNDRELYNSEQFL